MQVIDAPQEPTPPTQGRALTSAASVIVLILSSVLCKLQCASKGVIYAPTANCRTLKWTAKPNMNDNAALDRDPNRTDAHTFAQLCQQDQSSQHLW